jgi:uncharacterized SAM-binding protein YcdF (DUF218 family)
MCRTVVAVAGITGIFLLGTLVALMIAGRSFLTVSRPLKKADAIVLLAGSYEERAPHAAALFSAGSADSIILTNDGVRRGWSRKHQRNLYSFERSTEELVQRGVPRQAIIVLPFYKSGTIYDALAVREYVSSHNIGSILLVTSNYHTRRSLWIFRRVLQQLPVTIAIEPTRSTASMIPGIAVEYVKLAYYLIRFGWFTTIPSERN